MHSISRISSRCLVALLLAASVFLGACAGLAPKPAAKPAQATAQSVPAKPLRTEPEINPQSRAAYERAVGLLKAQRYDDAEQQFIDLVAKEPKLAGPHANLGILYRRQGKNADAIRALEHAIDLNPRAAYYNELGLAHRAEGRFDRAKRAYEKAIDLDADYAYAHLNLGILYDLYLQEPDKALTHYERYQVLAPSEAGTVAKWIADLKRRTNRTADQKKGEKSG